MFAGAVHAPILGPTKSEIQNWDFVCESGAGEIRGSGRRLAVETQTVEPYGPYVRKPELPRQAATSRFKPSSTVYRTREVHNADSGAVRLIFQRRLPPKKPDFVQAGGSRAPPAVWSAHEPLEICYTQVRQRGVFLNSRVLGSCRADLMGGRLRQVGR